MSGFAIDWLDLRAAADSSARNKTLAQAAVQWLQDAIPDGRAEPVVVDLGAGTGSTLRAFLTLGAPRAVWRLVDHDGALLDEALRRHGKSCTLEDYQADLGIVEELPLGGACLVTASALFDLTSQNFINRLVKRLQQTSIVLYAALNYDGTTQWYPTHPLDAAVLNAFNQDQRRDKGLGPALGPAAVDCLQAALQQAGFTIQRADSPWLLSGQQYKLAGALVEGIAAAVVTGYGLEQKAVQDWLAFRLAHVLTGTCRVGHQDLLALPRTRSVNY